MSFALESGNIFTFRYKNGVFYFDKEFYHYLDMPEKPISAEEFSNAIHADEQADFLLNRYKLDHGFPSRQITRRRYDFNKKGMNGGSSDMRKIEILNRLRMTNIRLK